MLHKIDELINSFGENLREQFHIQLEESKKDFFIVHSENGKICLTGNNPVSLASAFYYYLVNTCHVQVTWEDPYPKLPEILPLPQGTIRKETPYAFRYAYNYCTFNYTMTWWSEERWKREIHWLALHGFNMPLAANGHEKVWERVCERLSISKRGLKEYLVGPAFYAWNYMGNVDAIGGPVPDTWIDDQAKLQETILEEERAYGMKPVLIGFYGHVPRELKDLYPDANIVQLDSWFDAEGVYYLDPLDPLFKKVAYIFYEEQEKLYGNDHLYSMDLFHEGSSPDNSDDYLISRSMEVYQVMKEYDPQGKWVMQAWTYRDKVAEAIPTEDLIILDLYADEDPRWENTKGFSGKNFIWCMLHNFGGRHGLFGHLKNINEGPIKALSSRYGNQMLGIGIAPEAIEENEVFYELLTTIIWEKEIINLKDWLAHFVKCRYGQYNEKALQAWNILFETVYNGVSGCGSVDSVVCARPQMTVTKVCNSSIKPYYDLAEVHQALELLLSEKDQLKEVAAYRYDVINIARDILAMKANDSYKTMMEGYRSRQVKTMENGWEQLKAIILQMDVLLGTHEAFMLGKWLHEAKLWSTNKEEEELYHMNAKMQVSRWWPDVNFLDYAHKQWNGLIKAYYLPRWQKFYDMLEESLNNKRILTRDAVQREMITLEEAFYFGNEVFTHEPCGNYLEEAFKSLELISSIHQ